MPESAPSGLPARRVLGWIRLPSLMAGAIYALAGGGFIVATLIMARVLSDDMFGQAVIVIALCNVSIAVAPAGLNGITLRHDLRSDVGLLVAGALTATSMALAASVAGVAIYHISLASAAVLFMAITAGGIALLARSAFQRAQKFQRMVALYQIANGVLLVAALIMWTGVVRTPWFPTFMVGSWYLVLGFGAWRWVFARQIGGKALKLHMWRDAANFGSVSLASEITMQLERLLIPLNLGVHDLALYAIVSAIALAPFRMLEMGTMSTLTARLRHAVSLIDRRALLKHEIKVLLLLSVGGGVLIIIVGRYISALVRPELEPTLTLLAAVVVNGMLRVLSALAYGAAAAVCHTRELNQINLSSWIAVLIGAVGGWLMSSWGLVWLVFGVSLAWIWRAAMAAFLARPHLRAQRER